MKTRWCRLAANIHTAVIVCPTWSLRRALRDRSHLRLPVLERSYLFWFLAAICISGPSPGTISSVVSAGISESIRKPSQDEFVQPDYDRWRRVGIGMTESEVRDLLGEPRVKRTGPGKGDGRYVYGWIWFASDTFPVPFEFYVIFQNGKAVIKVDPFGGKLSQDGKPTAAVLFTPTKQQQFEHYPRFIDFRWSPSSGTYPMEYIVRIETEVGSEWKAEEFQTSRCYYCTVISGANRVRWKVKAKNSLGESDWSETRFFEFTY
jgi:hypothetical protein